MTQNVSQSETELYLGVEFEEGQIQIASHAYGKIGIGRIELKVIGTLFTHIKSPHCSDCHIRS